MFNVLHKIIQSHYFLANPDLHVVRHKSLSRNVLQYNLSLKIGNKDFELDGILDVESLGGIDYDLQSIPYLLCMIQYHYIE